MIWVEVDIEGTSTDDVETWELLGLENGFQLWVRVFICFIIPLFTYKEICLEKVFKSQSRQYNRSWIHVLCHVFDF